MAPKAQQHSEVWGPDSSVRETWQPLLRHLERLGDQELHTAAAEAATMVEDDGVTYTHEASGATGWNIDPIPYALGSGDWARLERALTQRLEVFNEVLRDAYGAKRLIKGGIVPPAVILGHPGFLRQAADIRMPGAHELIVAACDVGRDADGRWRAVADRMQAPNGAGFAMENRRIIARALPGVYRGFSLRRLSDFFETLRIALQQAAARDVESPRIVLFTPGPHSASAFDQANLATLLGFPLATSQDLTVHSGKLWLRTVDRLEQVDVLLRRVDAEWSDPLELRPDSLLGVPGLIDVVRRNAVTVVNPFGAALVESPALQPYFAAICREVLGEDLLLHPVQTWWLGAPGSLSHVRAHCDDLVLRNVRQPERTLVGAELSGEQREQLLLEMATNSADWVAQEPLPLSTTPSLRASGSQPLARPETAGSGIATVPTALVLRTFACASESGYEFMAGGLARVSSNAVDLQTGRSVGLLTKDVWVLNDAANTRATAAESAGSSRAAHVMPLSPRVAEGLFWFGRFVERCEFLARLQREQQDRRNEFEQQLDDASRQQSRAIDQVATQVLSAFAGAAGGSGGSSAIPAEFSSNLMLWMIDEKQPGSLAQTFVNLTLTARSVRDQMSTSTWSILARMSRALRDLRVHPDDAIAAPQLQNLLEAALALQGVMNESMVRDDGWNLMDAGRRIERAEHIAALLEHTLGVSMSSQADALLAESCLVVGESLITYRRRYANTPRAGQALELLARDTSNPRSVQFQLDRLETLHSRLRLRAKSRPLEEALQNARESLAGLDVWQACVTDGEGRRRGLQGVMAALQQDLREVTVAIEATYFAKAIAQRPL